MASGFEPLVKGSPVDGDWKKMSISTFRNMRDIIFLVAGVGLFMVVLDMSCRICCSMKKNRSSGGSPNTEMGIGTSTREMGNRGFEDNN